MSRKLLATLATAAVAVVGCTAPLVTQTGPAANRPPAKRGTVDVIQEIPVAELATDKPVPLDVADPCTGVPTGVVAPAGLAARPMYSVEFGCVWRGPGLGLEIGAMPDSMAKQVETHNAMAKGGSAERLAHLTWLRVDGHYAIERILEFDRTKSCRLTLDVSASATLFTTIYQIDPMTGEPADSDTETSVRELCPTSREVAMNLINYVDGDDPAWWETPVRPTR